MTLLRGTTKWLRESCEGGMAPLPEVPQIINQEIVIRIVLKHRTGIRGNAASNAPSSWFRGKGEYRLVNTLALGITRGGPP